MRISAEISSGKKRRTAVRRKASRRGVALLIVATVIAMLTLGGATLLTIMQTERDATTTRAREALVKSVDRSAVVFLLGTLEASRADRDKIGGVYDNPNYFCAAPLLTIQEGGEETSRFTVVSPKFDDEKIEGIRYGLVDESARLNLAAVLEWDAESPGAGRTALTKLPGMTATAADSILDWIDADENARQNGGETRYYEREKLPFSPRNAVPVFLEELLLARGVTRLQLYGADENYTFGAEEIDSNADGSGELGLGGSLSSPPTTGRNGGSGNGGAEAVPWRELLTVFSAEKDVDPTGEARVDLNGADLAFLYEELAPRVGEDLARFAVLYRQYGPATEEAENAATSTGNVSTAALDFAVPSAATLETPLDLVAARVVVENVVFESPLADSRAKANVDKLFQLLDFASTSPSTTIVGRVNVNAAPRAVLSAIPGLAAADVRRIIDERPDPTAALPNDFRHASWLYAKGIVELDAMKSLYRKTTAFGDVFRGQVVGFLDGTGVAARADVVVDGTTNPPRQVFYKDLTALGKGFSDAVLLGGLTSGNGANGGLTGTLGDGTADWNAVDAGLGTFEIENLDSLGGGRTSGYSSPFATVDQATGAGLIGGSSADVGNFAAPTPQTAEIPQISQTPETPTVPELPTAPGTSVDAALEAENAAIAASLDGAGTENVGTGETSGSATGTAGAAASTANSNDPAARRERMLNALQSARETRRASNQTAIEAQNRRAEERKAAADAALGGN